jgi:glycosyltransferase involved in cell wall biosynthesis/peptidoglycan/xylan/chitin deacetylase (PgdA/CDA1 family)
MTFTRGTRLSDKRTHRPAEPSISIVVPTFQRRDLVCEVVRSLCRLNYAGSIEIIVVVDGSTDGSADALAKIQCPWPLRVLEQDNLGASAARNRGAAAARNDVILFLDDDMIADPQLVAEHGRLYLEGADAVIGDTPIHPDSPAGFLPESVARWIASASVKSPLSPFDVFSGQLSVRRSVFQQLGGFDTALTSNGAFGNEDADFGVRLLRSHDVRHNPAAISRQMYVVTPGQYMARARRSAAADLHFLRKHPDLAEDLFDRKGIYAPLTRLIYLPLARINWLSQLIAPVAVGIANAALKTPFRSSRLIARLFSSARSFGYWSALRAAGWVPTSRRLLVLCYHAIEDQSDDPVLAPYGVSPDLFADQIDALADQGFHFVTPNQAAAFIESGVPLPRRPVLLTFDDGYADLVELARKVLQPRGIQALAFVVTGSQSGTNEWDQVYGAKTIPLLSAEERIKLAALGVEIGSHSQSHSEMPLLEYPQQLAEAAGSAEALAAQGLPRPRFFAYPFGYSDDACRKAVRSAEYLAAFGCRAAWIDRGGDRFDLPRIVVLATDRGWRFRAKILAPRLTANVARVRGGISNRFRNLIGRHNGAH